MPRGPAANVGIYKCISCCVVGDDDDDSLCGQALLKTLWKLMKGETGENIIYVGLYRF